MATLKSIIPQDFVYSITKIYEGIFNDYTLTKINFDEVRNTCNDLKAEIDARYNLDSLSGAKDIFRQIDYVLDKIDGWIGLKQLTGNEDAVVFMDAFKSYFAELEDMLDEMDSGEVKKNNKF